MITRRSFIHRASALAAGGASLPYAVSSRASSASGPRNPPRHIIHLVSDGMSMGTLTCADHLSRLLRDRGLTWLSLYRDPDARHGLMETRSLDSLVTDSSAASSAWGSGSLIANGAVNMLPDGRRLVPLYELFGHDGWARGLVTTTELTHATPAGFATAVASRGNAEEIALQYFTGRIEVLLGGGRPFFHPRRREDGRDLSAEFAQAGYSVVTDAEELRRAPADTKLLGTFASGHLPYTLDQMQDPRLQETVPTLAALTRAALDRLQRHEHFILQVEGGRVDHAAHNSDAAATLHDQIAFDEALDTCMEFRKAHPDTLVVVTTDHGNSNLGLNGMGGSYRDSSHRFAALTGIRASLPVILRQLEGAARQARSSAGADRDGDDRPESQIIRSILAETTGLDISERHASAFARVLAGEHRPTYDQMNSAITQLGQLLANYTGIGFSGNTHTSDLCPILAVGPGADRFGGMIANTDVFNAYTDLAGIDHRNPSVPLIAGAPLAPSPEDVAAYAQPEDQISA